jgi:hypothetical protein
VRAGLRALVAWCFVVAAFALVHPLAAEAHLLDHGKTVVFHDVYIGPDEVVDGDLNVVFGNATIAGRVRGDVNTLFGKCVKLDGAEIDGEEHCVVDDAALSVIPWLADAPSFGSLAHQDKQFWVKVGGSAIVLLMFLLFPTRVRLALDRVERHPGLAAFVGTAAMVAIIPLACLLLITIVGIPLIALEVVAIFVGIWLGTGAIALVVGRRLAELVWPRGTPSPLWALILGLVVVSAAETVPFVGWAVTAFVWLVGLGASILSFVRGETVETFRRTTIGGPPMPTRPA